MSNQINMTKRLFLQTVGMVGGSSAVLTAMSGLNIGFESNKSAPPEISSEGNGTKLVILGAGLAGMATAYEMSRRGYDCQIIEARDFAGGRCQTARKGFELEEIGGEKQVCDFDEGQYFNHGPWRIPPNHHSILHYCRELEIPIEVMINRNDSAYILYEEGNGPLKGKPIRRHALMADMRGYTSELLAKCADQGFLDEDMQDGDKELLVDYLKHEGYLNKKDMKYHGHLNRGLSKLPGAGLNLGEKSDPYNLHDLLISKLGHSFSGAVSHERPHAMFQVQGGMDKIAKAFEKHVGRFIKFSCVVEEIQQGEKGVRVTYKDKSGKLQEVIGDYCISTIPLAIMSKIKSNYEENFGKSLKGAIAFPSGKIGLQMDRRFWEEDDHIYGGSTYTDIKGHGSIAYPSHGFLGKKGIVQGYYNFKSSAVAISQLSMKERVDFAVEHGTKVHPQYTKEFSGKAFSVAWHRVPYSMSGWETWSKRGRRKMLPTLLKGDRRLFLAGTHMTPGLLGWQAGAIESAWYTMEQINQRVMQA